MAYMDQAYGIYGSIRYESGSRTWIPDLSKQFDTQQIRASSISITFSCLLIKLCCRFC